MAFTHLHVHTEYSLLGKTSADNFHQIGIPCIIFRQKHQMVIPVFLGRGIISWNCRIMESRSRKR